MSNEFKYQPSAVAAAVSNKVLIERLPEWMQSIEHIQMYFDNAIQPWMSPEKQDLVDGYIGDHGSPAAAGHIFLSEQDVQRQEYQLSPAYVSRNADTTVRSLQFYPDLVGYLNHYGANTDNESRLFNGNYYSWTPAVNPNKIMNFSAYVWDLNNEYNIAPDYVLMERGAINGNTWSLQNYWYTIGDILPDGTVLTSSMIISSRFARAQGPIIEFNKNIELVNYGSRFRSVVDYLSDSVKPEDIAQRRVSDNIRIDGNVLGEGDRVLFTSIGNSGENNRIYTINVKLMDDGTQVYGISLDEDEISSERTTGEPLTGDVVLVKKGTQYANKSFFWNGSMWKQTQVKTGINTFPQFNLYDKDGIVLSDKTKYPGSTFSGSSLFGFKINYDYSIDSVYGMHIELSSNNYYIYENFLQTQRFSYMNADVNEEIQGLYYFKIISENENKEEVQALKTDWVRNNTGSKQYVRQVPTLVKTSMYRIFSNLTEMENFSAPVLKMYAYVTDMDSTFQYNGTKWIEIGTEAIQSDIIETNFVLAQAVDPSNANDDIQIMVDGVAITDFEKVLSSTGMITEVKLNETLTENSIVTIRTYSDHNVPDKTMGAYEIPINLKNNPFNENIDYIHQGEFALHFGEIIQRNITSGTVNDYNNYESRLKDGLVDNSVGTYIIQNEALLFPMMISSGNENLDIFKAMQFTQQEYFRFKNRFNSRMLSMYDADPDAFKKMDASTIVDDILNALNLGKDSTFPFYTSAMGSTSKIEHTFIPVTPQFMGIMKTYVPQSMQYIQIGSTMTWYNIDHCGSVSKSYYILNGISLMDEVVLELETRIYNSIEKKFRDVDYVPVLNSTNLTPTAYNQNTEYTASEYDNLTLRGFVNFSATNGIDGRSHEYRQQDWTTWNYTGTTYIVNGASTEIPARGSWRGIFMDMYGTTRPHTHPWEMLGFTSQPQWWNLQYEATRIQIGTSDNEYVIVYTDMVKNENGDLVPSGLWDTADSVGDVSTGTILEGARKGSYKELCRFGKQPFTIGSTGTFAQNGQEIKTVSFIEPSELGMISGAISRRAEPWEYGDMGEMEFSYMNTAMYCFDNAMALLRAKPAQFMMYYYDVDNSVINNTSTGDKQFLFKDTNKRLDINTSTKVHGESGVVINGWQQWISEYLVWQNKDVTKTFGDIVRRSTINIGHRIGAFTKSDQIQFSTETYGNISQENQYIGMVKSSVIKSSNLSAVKIVYTGAGYVVSGYDLANAYFTVQVPNKSARRSTVQVDRKRVIKYSEYKDSTEIVQYNTEFKTVQDVYTFLCSYGEYLTRQGWIFEETTADGEEFNWAYIAKSFVVWTNSNPKSGEFVSMTTSASAAKFASTFGSVQSVTQFSGGVWSLIDDNNTGIRPEEIDTVRIGNVFSIRTLDDSDRRIALIRMNVVTYEHAVVFDDTTIFGDSLYIPKYGSVYEMIKMYGYVTGQWNGRLEAPGFIVLETGTLPNFEKLVNDFTKYYDNTTPVDNSTLRKLSRHLIGFQTRDYLSQMITNESSQVDFYRGFIAEKGTKQAFEKVLRVSKTYNTENYKALEEWAFKLGSYGNVDGKKHLQFQMINNEFTQEPQLFVNAPFSTEQPAGNTITHYGKKGVDSRWITRPKGNFSFPMRKGRSKRINLPDIGPVTLPEVDYSTVSFATSYASRAAFVYQMNRQPDKVWMFRDDSKKWNMFNVVNTGVHLLSIEPILYEGVANEYARLTFFEDHGLKNGDWYYLLDKTQYMPDILSHEAQYFSVEDPKTIIVPLALANKIIFGSGLSPDKTVILSYNDIRINANHPKTGTVVTVKYNDIRINANHPKGTSVPVTVTYHNIRINAKAGEVLAVLKTNNISVNYDGTLTPGTAVSGDVISAGGEITVGSAVTGSFTVGSKGGSTTVLVGIPSIKLDAEGNSTVVSTSTGTLVIGGSGGSDDSGKITIGAEHSGKITVKGSGNCHRPGGNTGTTTTVHVSYPNIKLDAEGNTIISGNNTGTMVIKSGSGSKGTVNVSIPNISLDADGNTKVISTINGVIEIDIPDGGDDDCVQVVSINIPTISLDAAGNTKIVSTSKSSITVIDPECECDDGGSDDSGKITIGDKHSGTIIWEKGKGDLSDCPVLYKYVPVFTSESQRREYSDKKYQYWAPESSLFERPSTYNSITNIPELYMNIHDPINGMIPGILMSEIKHISSYDPAMYNSDNTYNSHAWGNEHKGQVWWDTTDAFYLDYTRSLLDENGVLDLDATLEYARVNWGRLLPGYSIDIYEWVQSPVPPFEWDGYVQRQAKLNKNTSSWVPSGDAIESDYSVFEEYNNDTQTYSTFYYFWVKNSIYVPEVDFRKKSCNDIARCLANPALLETPWFSPVSDSAFITSDLQDEITDDKSILTIIWQMDTTDVIKHVQYQLCQEGMDYNFNPLIWNSLWNSLRAQEITDTNEVVSLLYPTTDFGAEPGKTWFKDVIEARREFVKSANNIYRTVNITTDTVMMNDIFNAKVVARNEHQIDFSVIRVGNEYVISAPGNTFVENDVVVLSSTGTLPAPLDTANVYFIHTSSDGYIRLMNSQSSINAANTIEMFDKGVGVHNMVLRSDYDASIGVSLDMTKYWVLSDWYADGYSADTLFTNENSTEEADLKNYLEGDVIKVKGEDSVWTLYVRKLTRDKFLWSAVGRQNSTVKLNDNLFSSYEMYSSNGEFSTEEKAVRQALLLLKDSFNSLQSRLVFDMVKYAHKEQRVIDWVYKTSYIYVVGLEQSLQRNYLQRDDLITQIVQYFNEVKPYHTKIRSQIEQKTSDDDAIRGTANDLSPDGFMVVDGETVKREKDIWDYERAVLNEVTGKWEIQGELPANFETPDRSFQEMNIQMYYDNTQVQSSTDLVSSNILNAVNNKYVTTNDDIQIKGSDYKLSRFSFKLPEINNTVIDNTVKNAIFSKYTNFDSSLSVSAAIAKLTDGLSNVEIHDLLKDIDSIVNASIQQDPLYVEYKQFSQFNTLVNRLKINTTMTDEQIAEAIQSSFKGRVINDNPNTRLPGGYSSSTDKNYGYVLETPEVLKTIRDKAVAELGSDASADDVLSHMRYEYGVYQWFNDIETDGPNFTDSVYVLAAMRGMRNISDSDPMQEARSILQYYQTAGEYAMIMVPRKYFKAKTAEGAFEDIPWNESIQDHLEDLYNSTNAIYGIVYDNLDDLPVQMDNPLYSTHLKVLESVDSSLYVNDVNGYDSSGYEDQFNIINDGADGEAIQSTEPMFIDISEFNPNGEELSEIKFAVHGYNYTPDVQEDEVLRDIGVGSVSGAVIQNPYNRKEVLVSIPRYDEAINLMDANVWNTVKPKFFHKVHAVVDTSGTLKVPGHDLVPGEKVAVFLPNSEDYQFMKPDGTLVEVMDVSDIMANNRPVLFTVKSVTTNNVVLNGLVAKNAVDISSAPGMTLFRVTSFADASFNAGNKDLYMSERRYTVSVLNYELFYDRMITTPDFSDNTPVDEYDGWYVTNEFTVLSDGTEIDHGFYIPQNDEGTLSELVRTKVTEFVQMTFIEYDSTEIMPVLADDGTWTYSHDVVNSVYIPDVDSSVKVMYTGIDVEGWNVVSNMKFGSATIIDDKLQSSEVPEFGDVISNDSELMQVRYNSYVQRGIHNSAQHNFGSDEHALDIINFGNEADMDRYMSGVPQYSEDYFSTGNVVNSSADYKVLLGA